jgi:hypothetical protein
MTKNRKCERGHHIEPVTKLCIQAADGINVSSQLTLR